MEVLQAAGTTWNFLKFRPGLVGGHCIGVDPFYLTYKAELAGYHPEVILAGRRINDGMGAHLARKTIQQLIHAGRGIKGARVNILGLTFKEDVPDIRNSKVMDVVNELKAFGVDVHLHDPSASAEEALHEYGVRLERWQDLPAADALILAVAHRSYLELPKEDLLKKVVRHGVVIDVKSVLDAEALRHQGIRVWRL
jgi:UDP-N-acetyl-D-galactosamine dehydrogenase